MSHELRDFVDPDGLDPGESALLQRVHDLIVEAGPPAGYVPEAPPATHAGWAFPRHVAPAIAAGVAIAAVVAGAAWYVVAGWSPGAAGNASAAALPRQGVLVHGESLAGVQLGDTEDEVRARWGLRFRACEECAAKTWLFLYPNGEPFGAGVRFRDGKVTAVFTLGAPAGWRDDQGLRVGQLLDPQEPGESDEILSGCMGYGATSTRDGDAVSSVLTQGLAVYGFALTRPSEPVCQ